MKKKYDFILIFKNLEFIELKLILKIDKLILFI